MLPQHPLRPVLAAAAALLLGVGVAACGGGDHEGHDGAAKPSTPAATTADATASTPFDPVDVDRAFVRQMIPHHELAVEMAELAADHAEHSEVKRLAAAVIEAQSAEIDTLKAQAKALEISDYDAPEKAAEDAATLGLGSSGHMGMDMDASKLKDADPFDLAFIDDMIPHHAGAIAMAEAEIAGGSDPALKTLAEAIVKAQTKEIGQLQGWRAAWYPDAPAASTPADDAGMDHSDHSGMSNAN